MIELSIHEARKIAVLSQRLIGPTNKQGIRKSTIDVINQIGYVQIDTISVVERAHHHKFWSRVEGYSSKILAELERKKLVFEYWSHAASYLPIDFYRFTLPVKQELTQLERFWYPKDKKVMQSVLDRVKLDGPLMSREFEDAPIKKEKGWPAFGPIKMALQNLFMEGRLMVIGRKGFQKIYDLPERWLPNDVDTSMPSRREYIRFLIDRDLKAHGLVTLSDIGYLIKGVNREIKDEIDLQIEKNEIVKVQVKGIKNHFYTYAETLEILEVKGYRKKCRILSPFDNLIINRKRTASLFDFDYLLECYVPQKKRKFGYFGLPILWDNQLVGLIDAKVDRRTKILLIRNLEMNAKFKRFEKLSTSFLSELRRFAEFNKCQEMRVSSGCSQLAKKLNLQPVMEVVS